MPDLRNEPASIGGGDAALADPIGLATGARAVSRTLLVVCNDYDYFMRHRSAAMEEIACTGARVIVCCGGRLPDAKASDRLEFRHLDCERFRFAPIADLGFTLRLFGVLLRERPDILHTITIKPNLYGGLAAAACRMLTGRPRRFVMMNPGLGRLFASRRGGWRESAQGMLVRLSLRLALAGPSSLALFENHGDRRQWVTSRIAPRSRTAVLPGAGVDTAHFHPPASGRPAAPFRFLFASRMLRAKGIGAFLAAAQLLEAEGCAAEFLVAGEVDPRDPDHYPVDALELPGNVRYLGNLPDSRDALQSAHVVCLPTAYGEGLPRILIEAAAAGCALVASDHPACRPIVREGVTGHLVPLGQFQEKWEPVFRPELREKSEIERDRDSGKSGIALAGGAVDPKALAQILRRMTEHPEETKVLGDNARALVLRGGFGQKSVNRRFAALILGREGS